MHVNADDDAHHVHLFVNKYVADGTIFIRDSFNVESAITGCTVNGLTHTKPLHSFDIQYTTIKLICCCFLPHCCTSHPLCLSLFFCRCF